MSRLNKELPLAERIEQICAEAEAFIDERTAALKVSYPNQPIQSLRLNLTKNDTCACRVALRLLKDDSK
jgi:hypothetical protein